MLIGMAVIFSLIVVSMIIHIFFLVRELIKSFFCSVTNKSLKSTEELPITIWNDYSAEERIYALNIVDNFLRENR